MLNEARLLKAKTRLKEYQDAKAAPPVIIDPEPTVKAEDIELTNPTYTTDEYDQYIQQQQDYITTQEERLKELAERERKFVEDAKVSQEQESSRIAAIVDSMRVDEANRIAEANKQRLVLEEKIEALTVQDLGSKSKCADIALELNSVRVQLNDGLKAIESLKSNLEDSEEQLKAFQERDSESKKNIKVLKESEFELKRQIHDIKTSTSFGDEKLDGESLAEAAVVAMPKDEHKDRPRRRSSESELQISTLTARLMALESTNKDLAAKMPSEDLLQLVKRMKAEVEAERRISILLQAELDSLPDMITKYRIERDGLLKRVNKQSEVDALTSKDVQSEVGKFVMVECICSGPVVFV